MTPAVSICLPSYNYGRYMAAAIESVLRQTSSDWELVIVDDVSSDNSVEVAMGFAARDARIRVYKNNQNLGMADNWNCCMEYAVGRYIKFLCGDDMLEPMCLEKMLKVLDKCPNISLVTSARLYVDEHLKPIKLFSYAGKTAIYQGTEAINRCLFNGNYIGEPTAVMFRKKDAGRGFNRNYRHLMDLEMWFHLLEQGDLAVLPQALCRFRQHDKQGTKNNVRSLAFLSDEIMLYQEYIVKPYIRSSRWNLHCWKFRVAYSVWKNRRYMDKDVCCKALSPYCTPMLFRFWWPLGIAVRKLVKGVKYRNWYG